MILLIDNYDSFVYNLARYFELLQHKIRIFRNDAITLQQIKALAPQAIVISPGPCTPNEAGISLQAIRHFSGKIPILGVCLGHQAIASAFGGNVCKAQRPMHGSGAPVHHRQQGIFQNLPNPLIVGRYHSLVIHPDTLPNCLKIIATSDEQEIMAVQHRKFPIIGLQFHPESILTPHGKQLIKNFSSHLAKL